MSTSGASPQHTEYARRLYARLKEAMGIDDQTVVGDNGWKPSPQQCHDNVARFVAENPSYAAVHGWYVSDLGPNFSFIAHSIVRSPDGRLINITPTSDALPWKYPFLEDDDPAYWSIADGAPNRTIMCEAKGRSKEDIAARQRVMDKEHAAAFRNPAVLLRLLGLR